ERHELVIAKAGDGPAHPDVQKHEKENLEAEPEYWQQRLQNRRTKRRAEPASKKHQGREARHGYHVAIFGDKKHGELHRAVLGVISRYKFRLGFRQIEGSAVGLRISGNQVDKKCQRLNKDVPVQMALCIDDLAQAETASYDQDS